MKKSLIALGSKKPVVAATIAALLGGAAVTANAVEVSRDGTGDFLIAPAYMIGGGLTTDLKVINTSDTDSVVAKVVFRHPVTSAETLDFLIYLSPSDVWTGTVSCQAADAAGNCTKSVVTSKDDSIQLPNSTSFASATVASEIVSDNATASATGRVALPNQGYIETPPRGRAGLPGSKTMLAGRTRTQDTQTNKGHGSAGFGIRAERGIGGTGWPA